MKSSYNDTLTYKDLLENIIFLKKPKKIVEFGILEGFSLEIFAQDKKCQIEAYDIFEDFKGNGSDRNIIEKFKDYHNISINYGDFYKKVDDIENNSLDILHIDIAKNGDVYEFAIKNYMQKLKKDGLMILEGGSKERDEVEWMNKYQKRKIRPYLDNLNMVWKTFGEIPSITIIKSDNFYR